MVSDTVTLKDFTRAHRISMTAERVSANPNMADSRDMDHWKVVFTRRRSFGGGDRSGQIIARMTTYFSMGYGHNGAEPRAKDVLDCLASDASSVDQEVFEEWARNMGYDEDSRKAEKVYRACEHGAKRLKKFLGEELYETLLYKTEKL